MSSSGWSSVIQWSIWVVLMVAVTGWIARSRSRAAAPAPGDQLRQPVSTLVVGMTAFLFFAAIAVISNVFANETTTWWTTSIFVGFAALGAWMIASYYVERHDLSEGGMRHRSLLGGTTELAWSDVVRVRYSSGSGCTPGPRGSTAARRPSSGGPRWGTCRRCGAEGRFRRPGAYSSTGPITEDVRCGEQPGGSWE